MTYKILPILLACLLLSSCETPLPIDAEIVQIAHAPLAQPPVAAATSTPQPRASIAQTSLTVEEIFLLRTIGGIVGEMAYYGAALEPALTDKGYSDYFLERIVAEGEALGLNLEPELIADTKDLSTVFVLVDYLALQIETSNLDSSPATAVFYFDFYEEFYKRLLDKFVETPPEDNEITRGWFGSIARGTNVMVLYSPLLGIDQEQAREGLQIAQQFQLLSQQEIFSEEDLSTIADRFAQWSSSAGNESFFALQGRPTPSPTPTVANQVGTDITIQLPSGDAGRGAELHESFACSACHLADPSILASGPSYGASDYEYSQNKTLVERAQTTWQSESYTGEAVSTEQYLLESIVLPDTYIVPGYRSGLHPLNWYDEQLSVQDAADLIAYLKTFD